jgi:hypothetical protein
MIGYSPFRLLVTPVKDEEEEDNSTAIKICSPKRVEMQLIFIILADPALTDYHLGYQLYGLIGQDQGPDYHEPMRLTDPMVIM